MRKSSPSSIFGEKMSKARALGEQGVSVVLGAILVMGIIIGAISIIYPMYVRNAIRDKETEHSRVVGEKFAELKSKIEDMEIGESRTVIMPTSRGQATLVPSSGELGAISVYPSAFTTYPGWRQTKWSQSTSPELQSGPWDITYENFYESENLEFVENENITLQAGKTSGSLTSSVCDATTDIRWGVVNWSDYIPVKIENYSVQDEPTPLIDGNPRIGENVGSYLKTWALDNDYENIREADENIQAKFLYVENCENYKGRVENFSYMKENVSATYATLIERAHSGTYAQENPILNGTFTGSAANWTYSEVPTSNPFADGGYDPSDGNPPPGSGPGSYKFTYQDTDGAYQTHYFLSITKLVNKVTARLLAGTLENAPLGIIDRPSIPPGWTILVDEWHTDVLGITKLPAGLWTFKYWGFRTSADNSGSAQLLVDIYRRNSNGQLLDIVGAVKVAAADLSTELSEVTGTYYMSEQGMNTTDSIVIQVYARNTSEISQTVYFYFSSLAYNSRMITTITVPRTDNMRISQTFTAPQGTYVGNISAKFAFKSDVGNLDNASYKVRFLLIQGSTEIRVMYQDLVWRTDNRAWATYYDNLIPTTTLTPGTSYIIRVEVQVYNPNKWERPRVWVNVDDISLTFTIQRYDMDIGFTIPGVTTNNYLEMRYRLDNFNDQFRVWVYDNSTGTWNPRGENLRKTSWTFWSYRLGENENDQTGQVKLRIVDRDNMAKLATNLMIDFIRVRSGGLGYRLSWGHRFENVPVTGSYTIKIYGWATSGENVGVYVWKPSIDNWSFISNLPNLPEPGSSLAEALDTTLSISTGGNANWFGQTSTYYYDGDAAQSGPITHNQQTYIETTVTGPDTLKFWWKVSSELNFDYLRFYIDNVQQVAISGETAWAQRSYAIGAGSHTLKWAYTKDPIVTSGSDAGWVDKVEFGPAPPPLPPPPPIVWAINIEDYVVGNDLWIKYGDNPPVADNIQSEIYIDYCVLEGEKPLDVKITVEVRTGSDSDPRDGGWGDWENIPKGGPIVGPYIRFLQYRVTMWTANPVWMPILYEISIGVEEMGSIKFEVKNLIYPDQAWLYEGGGVILAQYDLNAMRSNPPLITIRDVGDNIEVIVNTVTIENFPVSYTSSVPVTITATVKDIYYAVQDENRDEVIIQVGSSYQTAWTNYFSALVDVYNGRGYNASFDENTLSLTIKGKNLTPGVYDIIYSKKVKVIEVSFG